MFTYDDRLAQMIFDYCRERISLDSTPLDFGSLQDVTIHEMDHFVSDEGHDPEVVLKFFREKLAHSVISADSPGFLAFIPNAPSKAALLFDMVVACSGLNGTSWLESAGVVVAENQALSFLAERAGLPEGAGGCFVSGGSIANLSALTVGRDVGRSRRPEIAPHELRFAISADAHSSVGKALHVLGLGALLIEPDDHRLTIEGLRAALAADEHPETVIGVVATCGTTNAGIVDDLEGLGAFCRENQLWFHVDGAYGGASILSPSHREMVSGLRHADSFIVDPHKWLFAPLDCAALLYRNPRVARAVHTQHAGYLDILHEEHADHFDWNPSDFAIHLSRRARGLPFWFSLVTNGVSAYESAVERGIELAERAARLIDAADHVELVREPSLSIVLFRRLGWSPERYNEWSHQLLLDQVAFVTPTKWEGETVARFAFLHPNTTDETIHAVLDSMRD
jgi:glutamate/tyrosine decarboxylase-like PLP-dependent enzyme